MTLGNRWQFISTWLEDFPGENFVIFFLSRHCSLFEPANSFFAEHRANNFARKLDQTNCSAINKKKFLKRTRCTRPHNASFSYIFRNIERLVEWKLFLQNIDFLFSFLLNHLNNSHFFRFLWLYFFSFQCCLRRHIHLRNQVAFYTIHPPAVHKVSCRSGWTARVGWQRGVAVMGSHKIATNWFLI